MTEKQFKRMLLGLNNTLRIYLNDRYGSNREQRSICYSCIATVCRNIKFCEWNNNLPIFDYVEDFDMFNGLEGYQELYDTIQNYICE